MLSPRSKVSVTQAITYLAVRLSISSTACLVDGVIVMLAECALALLNPEKLSPFAQKGGVLTTATAFGDELVDRLNKTGKIQIESKLAKARDQGVDGKPVHY